QARVKTAHGDLGGARALCDKYLKRFPQHSGFLALQKQVAEREQQTAIEFRRQTDEALESAKDMDARLRILQAALTRYPDQPYYREALELVNSARRIADESNSLEKAGRFAEAVDSWTRLTSIYPAFPNLPALIQRASDQRDKSQREA